MPNNLNIRELSGVFPGETEASLKGDVFSNDEVLTYNLESEASTNDLQKFLSWLGYEVNPVAPSTYRRAVGKADIAGNLHNVKISPFELTLDKTVFKGEAGIIRNIIWR